MYVKVFKRNAVKDHSKEVSPVYQRGSLLLWVDECGLAALLLVCLLHVNLRSFCTHTGEKESHINMDLVVIKLVDIIEFLKVQYLAF